MQANVVLRASGAGDGWFHGRQVQFQLVRVVQISVTGHSPQVLCLEVVFVRSDGFFAPACLAQIVGAAFIHGEEAHGGAVFRGHVCYGSPVCQRQGRRPVSEEFHKFAYDAVAAQHLGDMQRQVRGGHSFAEFSRHMDAHYFRHQERDGLAEHPGFRLNAANTPAHNAYAVNHRGMGIRSHQGIREVNAILFHHALRQVFQIDLVDNAHGRRNHGKSLKGLLAPFEEFVAFRIALEFNVQVLFQSIRASCPVHLDGVVHHQVHGDQRFNDGGVFSQSCYGGAHGRQVHQKRDARQVLQDNAGYRKRDFIGTGIVGIPGGQVVHVLFSHFQAVAIAEQGFQNDPDGNGKAVQAGIAVFRQGWQ